MKKLAIALAIAGAATVGACGDDAPRAFDGTVSLAVTGKIDLLSVAGLGTSASADLNVNPDTSSCSGTNGYSDLSPGGQATLTNENGTTVAVASVAAGSYDRASQTGTTTTCTFKLTFVKIPGGGKFYSLKIGSRPTRELTEQQLKDGASLTLGGS